MIVAEYSHPLPQMWLPAPHLSFVCFLWLSCPSFRETQPVLVCPWEACLVVGTFVSTNSSAHPDVVHSVLWWKTPESLWGRVSCPQVLKTTSPIQLLLASIMSDQMNIMQCFFWSALLVKNRLLVGQNRLSPCKWGVKGHNFMNSHLSLSQRHFRLVVCLHW